MDREKLERVLQSVGKECFVRYFDRFADERLSVVDLIDELVVQEKYSEQASRTRVNNARRIIKSNCTEQAFAIIVSSKRLPVEIIEIARLKLQALIS